jgi:hypothetical protein
MVASLTDVSTLQQDDFDPSNDTISALPDVNAPVSVTISRFGKTLYPVNVDYAFRSKALDFIPLYHYKRFLEKVPMSASPPFHFLLGHPQVLTHGLKLRSRPVIPNVFFTIPSGHSDDPVKRHTYSSVIFVLFHPWRNLVSDFTRFSLDAFLAHCSFTVAPLINNVNLLASSKQEAQLLAALRETQRLLAPAEQQQPWSEFEMDPSLELAADEEDGTWMDLFSMDELDHSAPLPTDSYVTGLLAAFPDLPASSITVFRDTDPGSYTVQEPLTNVWKLACDTLAYSYTLDGSTTSVAHIPSQYHTRPTFLEPFNALLEELGDRQWIHTSQAILDRLHMEVSNIGSSRRSCPLDPILSAFSLNREQTLATKLVGYKLLNHLDIRFPQIPHLPNRPQDNEPLRMYIGGEGGTGKSHVIRAIKHLFEHFQYKNALLCMAPTGVAAYNIGASTIHSNFGFSMNSGTPTLTPSFIDKMEAKFRGVYFLLIDEISMVSAQMLSFMDRVLRSIREPSLPFGGMHIITLGDFCQLAPVAKAPLYADLSGSEIWRTISHVIILKHQVRAASDPAFRALLTRSREHQNTQDDFSMLQSRLLGHPTCIPTDLHAPQWIDATVILTRKKAAKVLNLVRLRAFCAAIQTMEIVFPATDCMQGLPVRSADIRTRLVDLEQSGAIDPGLPRSIHLAIGARVSLTYNIKTEIGLVNGAQGTVANILLVPGTQTNRSESAPNCLFLDRPPIVLFKPCDPHPSLATYTFAGLEAHPPGLVPIVPIEHSFRADIWANSHTTKMSFTRKQLPLILSYAVTDYKAQGRSLTHAFIDLKAPPGKRDANSFYVMLSRLTSLQGLRILREFDPSKLNVPVPLPLANELRRLANLDIS